MPRSDQQFSLLPPIIPYNKRTNARTTKTNVRAKKRTRARTTEPLRFSSASASCFKFNEFTEAFCTCFLFVMVITIQISLNLHSPSTSMTPRASDSMWLPITVFGTATRTLTPWTTNLTEKEDNNFWNERTTQLPKTTWRSSRLSAVISKWN